MEGSDGSRLQAAMRQGEAVEDSERRMVSPIRAVISGVRFQDTTGRKLTVVDCYVLDRTGRRTERGILYNVPLLYPKTNRDNGEEWTPEAGDFVLIGFINANLRDPVVLGYLAAPGNAVQATAAKAPRSYRKRSGTSEEIDPDGNRIVHVAANETLTVVGDGEVNVQGSLTIVVGGNATVNVSGTANVTCPQINISASSGVQVTTPELSVTGKIKASGDIASTAGNIKDPTGTLAALRTTYNSHTHNETGQGGGTTLAPNQTA